MAAPSHVTLGTPDGVPLEDGYGTLIVFSQDPDIPIWEAEITPIGIDGGEMISTTTKRTTVVHTGAARKIVKITPCTGSCAYSMSTYARAMNIVNVEGAITIYHEGGGQSTFYGYLQSFKPGPHKEGEQPRAEIAIAVTNVDPDTREEEQPVFSD